MSRFKEKNNIKSVFLTSLKLTINFCIVFRQVDNEFLEIARHEALADGTTCLMALITNCKLTIANLGDSSAILIRNN
jgi:serine/threonine protein phosphatase PrpC